MPRPKKNKKSFHLRIAPEIIESTADKANKQGLDTSDYIEQVLRRELLENK